MTATARIVPAHRIRVGDRINHALVLDRENDPYDSDIVWIRLDTDLEIHRFHRDDEVLLTR